MACLGRSMARWTLDAFDFSIFLLIMLPIAQDFNVPLTAVTAVYAITLWLRLAGATASGWLSDRIGRKKPLMISIYGNRSAICGRLSPIFRFLFLFRALLGIGMGAEWPVGAALAMETWPQRSRGLMGGILQASWGIGSLLSSERMHCCMTRLAGAACWSWVSCRRWLVVYIRRYVKEPESGTRTGPSSVNRRREVRDTLVQHLQGDVLGNTLNACWWMASGFVVAYSIGSLFPTHLQKDLGYSPTMVALPVMAQSFLFFCSGFLWGWVADKLGRRWALILPAIGCLILTPLYLFTHDYTMIVVFFGLQGMCGAGGMYGQTPAICPSEFRPRCAPRPPGSAIIKGRSLAA